MPLFEITPDIQRMGLPITPGWHPMQVEKAEDNIPGDGKAKTTVFTHKIIGGKHKGQYVWVNVSHDRERMHYGLNYIKFQLGKRPPLDPEKTEKVELTKDNVAYKQFEGYVENRTSDSGTIFNQISKFRPLSTAAKTA